jgi:pyruvate, water dikinase
VLSRIARIFRRSHSGDLGRFRELFERFQQILKSNNRVLEIISELDDKLGGEYIFDINYLKSAVDQLSEAVYFVSSNLNVIADNRYRELFSRQAAIHEELKNILEGHHPKAKDSYVVDYADVDADMAEFAGAKNANLGEIRNHLEMLTPEGFVISTAAYRRFMDDNNLWPEIERIRREYAGEDRGAAENYDHAIAELFESARIPEDIVGAIEHHIAGLRKLVPNRLRLAVRSSARGEDSLRQSFAGQFDSILNCRDNGVLKAYTMVVASRFKRSVFAYAGENAYRSDQQPMAVGVQQMINARAAGVAYSIEPSGESPESMSVSAGFGLGTSVVGGTTRTDFFTVSRLDPTRIVSRRIRRKTTQMVTSDSEGVSCIAVPDELQEMSCLTDDQVLQLAEKVLRLDRYFKWPVDVEWCFDQSGRLYILQCRPLRLSARMPKRPLNRMIDPAVTPIMMKSQGQVAQRGIAAGRVRQIHEDDDISDFPAGAIAVTKYTTPRLVSIIRNAAAIVTDVGSPSGHMATVAREFGVPMIVNAANATRLLTEGTEVTIDAEENVIYRGIVKALLDYKAEAEDVYRDLKEYHILRQLLRRISPLNLIDPKSPDFTAKNCRTYHDIVRFSHELAVKILVDLNISSRRFRGVETRELILPIPLGLHIIDLGGGVVPNAGAGMIDSVEKIQSSPMRAFLDGLVTPGVWSTDPVQLGFGDLVSSLTRYSMADRVAQYQGQNLAVITDHYANISLRLGYHFNVIDTYVSENVDDNYVYFRFVGGVTETERRHLRALLLKEILEKLYFRVTLKGDLVVARLKKLEDKKVLGILHEIGRLVGFTRQLDTRMQSERSVAESLRTFFERPQK